ncbi:hypothetical protein HZC53_06345 [Candidatus Uhrbacteria bacterium]|nr:hypothetical protein [Candidatus Uhrbacteria bacterium]
MTLGQAIYRAFVAAFAIAFVIMALLLIGGIALLSLVFSLLLGVAWYKVLIIVSATALITFLLTKD